MYIAMYILLYFAPVMKSLYYMHSTYKNIGNQACGKVSENGLANFQYVIIRASLSKPQTSKKNGTSVAFTKIYVEIQINGTTIMRAQKFKFINQVITYKCFRLCVHHTNGYQSSLLTRDATIVVTYDMS